MVTARPSPAPRNDPRGIAGRGLCRLTAGPSRGRGSGSALPQGRARPSHASDIAATAAALTAPGRPTLDYAGLRAHVDAIGRQLAGQGLASDRVAIVLLNGPEMAAAFLAVAALCRRRR